MSTRIVVAGATGQLGGRIARALLLKKAEVVALVRRRSDETARLAKQGAIIVEVDFGDAAHLAAACAGASCVVSALSGLGDVIVDAQTQLVDAAVAAKVPRFIPSDFAADFFKQPRGWNRNFDLRRDFAERLPAKPIQVTSILNGAFADMLVGEAPFVLFPIARALYWGSADQLLDFTTMDDVATYTAEAALDSSTPRFLRIAGDVLSARGLAAAASAATGKNFKLLRAGSLGTLSVIIKIARTLHPAHHQVFPAWQGMQYMHDMFSGRPKLDPLDNDRYGPMRFTSAREVLATRAAR